MAHNKTSLKPISFQQEQRSWPWQATHELLKQYLTYMKTYWDTYESKLKLITEENAREQDTLTREQTSMTKENVKSLRALPPEITYRVFKHSSPAALLSLSLASKYHLKLLFDASIKTDSDSNGCGTPDDKTIFTPASAIKKIFMGACKGRETAHLHTMRFEEECYLSDWLKGEDGWKVCMFCLAFLRPLYEGEKRTWPGVRTHSIYGPWCHKCYHMIRADLKKF